MTTIELRNQTDHNFTDISSEQYREYRFGESVVRLDSPAFLAASANGHRVLTQDGKCHYIPMGWVQLTWKVKDDQPHFVK